MAGEWFFHFFFSTRKNAKTIFLPWFCIGIRFVWVCLSPWVGVAEFGRSAGTEQSDGTQSIDRGFHGFHGFHGCRSPRTMFDRFKKKKKQDAEEQLSLEA